MLVLIDFYSDEGVAGEYLDDWPDDGDPVEKLYPATPALQVG